MFGKELKVRKLVKLDDTDPEEIETLKNQINKLKEEIGQNTHHKVSLQKKLIKLEKERDEMLYNFRSEIDEDNSVDVLYNQHLLNLKDIEYARKEKQAEFHIKQREMYIENLKAQLAMRDQIIKEKLGASVTNFLKQDLLTMQDIEGVSQDVLLPSLKMTKSKQFSTETSDSNDFYSDMEPKKKKKLLNSDSNPYPLPSIQSDSSIYEDSSTRKLGYLDRKKSKNILSKRGELHLF